MKPVFRMLILAVLICFSSAEACHNQGDMHDASLYFPYKTGLTWVYAGEGNEYAGFTRRVVHQRDNLVQIVDSNGGADVAVVFKVGPEAVTKVFLQAESNTDKNYLDEPANKAEIILKAPLAAGIAWDDGNNRREVVSTRETVTVPAGMYKNVVKIKVSSLNRAEEGQLFEYYAANVGMIMREYIIDNNYKITSKLKEVARPKT